MLPVVDCYYILCYKLHSIRVKELRFFQRSSFLYPANLCLSPPSIRIQNVRSSCDKREIVCGFAGGELAVNIDYAGRGARVVEMLERRK